MEFIDRMFDVSGKVAVVTGGAGALGGLMAKGLAHVGARVCVLDLNEEGTHARVDEITQAGRDAIGFGCSVLDKEQLEQAKDAVLERWGSIDILLNAAGGNVAAATLSPETTIFDLPKEAFDKVFALNLMGTILPTQVFGRAMADQKEGIIINISSMTATRTISRVVGYSAAKAAVENFTRWIAVELAYKYGSGIRVNAFAPGFFIGEQNRALLLNDDGTLTDRGKQIVAHTPMGRFGEAEELIGTLIWLCSDASRFVTGVVVPVDGGFSIFSGV
jgi:NAD(P)-dependent dehydrogenase (short-subunit alcohol dehydrogenase family)